MHGPRVGPGDDHQVRVCPYINRCLDFADHLLFGDDLAAGHVTAFFRCHLVFQLDRSHAGLLVFAQRPHHIDGIAEPGIRVGNHRHIHGFDDIGRPGYHLGQRQQTDVRFPQMAGRLAVSGHIYRRKSNLLDYFRRQGVVRAWCDDDLFACHHLSEHCSFSHVFFSPPANNPNCCLANRSAASGYCCDNAPTANIR